MRVEICAWKRINNVNNYVSFIPRATFWVTWKERNKRVFYGRKADFDRIKDRLFQTLGFFMMSHPLYSFEGLEDLTDILIDK